ncbi:hypothetical protein G7Y89_g5396 [Cudoniella acicularis]|uniref:Uncharacterized protein n=1 Tax=Cudoniella acicularis TaxID=354080 RepID=A0A8H4W414_9HELO|nr:hypothetical protein G7Y89_g5396 [Cudoniella acicularis]
MFLNITEVWDDSREESGADMMKNSYTSQICDRLKQNVAESLDNCQLKGIQTKKRTRELAGIPGARRVKAKLDVVDAITNTSPSHFPSFIGINSLPSNKASIQPVPASAPLFTVAEPAASDVSFVGISGQSLHPNSIGASAKVPIETLDESYGAPIFWALTYPSNHVVEQFRGEMGDIQTSIMDPSSDLGVATFAANSGDLGTNISAHVLSSSSVVNTNVITNPSLISKASLVSRMVLQDLLRGFDTFKGSERDFLQAICCADGRQRVLRTTLPKGKYIAWIVIVFQIKSKTGPFEQGLEHRSDTLQPPYSDAKGKSFYYISKTCSPTTESSIEKNPSSRIDFLASTSAKMVDAIVRGTPPTPLIEYAKRGGEKELLQEADKRAEQERRHTEDEQRNRQEAESRA